VEISRRRQCEFRLLRYVPDAIRNEYVHIGVILRDAEEGGRCHVRMTNDWRRVRCLDPDADVSLLEALETEFLKSFNSSEAKDVARLEESLSLAVQMTQPKAYLAESIPAGIDELMRMYVDPHRREKMQRLSGRASLLHQMRGEFEQVGVWDLLRKRVAASSYTRPGDPLRIDASYRTDALVHMFHAVSLEQSAESAKVLAFSAAGLHTGVQRVEGVRLELTAIIEPLKAISPDLEDQDRVEGYRFAVATMEENRVRVLTSSDMSRVAARASLDLMGRE
jgi:hypothetical protein